MKTEQPIINNLVGLNTEQKESYFLYMSVRPFEIYFNLVCINLHKYKTI